MTDLSAGLIAFAVYFLGAIAYGVVFCVIYTRLTRHREFELIVAQRNVSAAVAFGGSLLGFAVALAAAIHNTRSVVEFAIWGAVALVTQLLAYGLARLSHPGLSEAIEENVLAAALWVAFVSVACSLVTAACMSP